MDALPSAPLENRNMNNVTAHNFAKGHGRVDAAMRIGDNGR
jgi:hypothetical protein